MPENPVAGIQACGMRQYPDACDETSDLQAPGEPLLYFVAIASVWKCANGLKNPEN